MKELDPYTMRCLAEQQAQYIMETLRDAKKGTVVQLLESVAVAEEAAIQCQGLLGQAEDIEVERALAASR